MDIRSITGAPGTIKLGEKTYMVAQPTDKDMGAIAAFFQRRAKSPVAALQDDPDFKFLSADEQRERLAVAAKKKFDQALPFDAHSMLSALTSVEGVRFMAWLLIHKADPSFTPELAASLITEENCVAVSVQLDDASGMAALGNSDGRPG